MNATIRSQIEDFLAIGPGLRPVIGHPGQRAVSAYGHSVWIVLGRGQIAVPSAIFTNIAKEAVETATFDP